MVSETILNKLIIVLEKFPSIWDCREAILEMRENNYPHWKQMEWIGFYFQYLCDSRLSDIGKIPGPKYGRSEFDGLFEIPWDFKAHPTKNSKGQLNNKVIVNDTMAIDLAIKQFGSTGLILASGEAEFNDSDRSFQLWHKKIKGGLSDYEKQRLLRDAPSRLRKTVFRLEKIDLILLDAETVKNLGSFQEGFRNSDGSPRNPKVLLDLTTVKPIRVISF